jgi:hypothetical protein
MVQLSQFTSASWQVPWTKSIDLKAICELNDDDFLKVHKESMSWYINTLWKDWRFPYCENCRESIQNYTELARIAWINYHAGCIASKIQSSFTWEIHKKYLKRVYEIVWLWKGEFQLEFDFQEVSINT